MSCQTKEKGELSVLVPERDLLLDLGINCMAQFEDVLVESMDLFSRLYETLSFRQVSWSLKA